MSICDDQVPAAKIVDSDVLATSEINVTIVLNELRASNDSNNVVRDRLHVTLAEDVTRPNAVNIDKHPAEICISSGEMFFVALDERRHNY